MPLKHIWHNLETFSEPSGFLRSFSGSFKMGRILIYISNKYWPLCKKIFHLYVWIYHPALLRSILQFHCKTGVIFLYFHTYLDKKADSLWFFFKHECVFVLLSSFKSFILRTRDKNLGESKKTKRLTEVCEDQHQTWRILSQKLSDWISLKPTFSSISDAEPGNSQK